MPASIGVNLRVTGHCSQGGRKYMEDLFSVAYQQTEDERDLEYAFFGIYDGHGGSEAAAFAKEHLMDSIVKQRQFWSDNDEDVLKAIRNGYMLTHLNMWKELEKWPKTVTGLPSTAGTTASVAFIRRGKIYIGHVGDSAIVLGYQKEGSEEWAAKPLTLDHKPECTTEIERIQRCGGKVVSKAGVPRVVWNRPRLGHKGPIKKNTPMDEIPFLAVARSLGDLWSYNPHNDEFIVSPDPDVGVLTIDPSKFRCLIFGTDGLWNMISPEGAVSLVQATERHNEAALVGGSANQPRDWLNPSKSLVDHALERWSNTRMRADNTSVVTLMLDPPGPPRATVLRSRTAQRPQPAAPPAHTATTAATPTATALPAPSPATPAGAGKPDTSADDQRPVPQNGLAIMTRYSDVDKPTPSPDTPDKSPLPPCESINGRLSVAPQEESPKEANDSDDDAITNYGNPAESYFMARLLNRTRVVNTLSEVYDEIVNGKVSKASSEVREMSPPATDVSEVGAGDGERRARDSPGREPAAGGAGAGAGDACAGAGAGKEDVGIQINEVSSSSPTEGPPRVRGRRAKAEGRQAAAAAHDRVLRSHHDAEPSAPRPQTRQAATRARPAPVLATAAAPAAQPSRSPHRVVILNRRTPALPPHSPPYVRIERTPILRKAPPAPPPSQPVAEPAPCEGPRATRSAATGTPLAQKITRSISSVARELRAVGGGGGVGRAGNSMRAPGPARRAAPAARRDPSRGSKENLGAARRRARARAAPPAPSASLAPSAHPQPPHPPRTPRRAASDPEVHSTTADTPCAALTPAAAPAPPERPRALRSRNEPDHAVTPVAVGVGGKRARDDMAPVPAAPAAAKTPKLSAERCAKALALGKRASGPWAPALALRNRLRKRLAK